MSNAAKAFIGWFGPRGLNSLLLALLVLQSGVAGAEFLLAVAGVVVTVSVMMHGASAGPLSALYGRAVERETHEEERESTAAGLFAGGAGEILRLGPEKLPRRWKARVHRWFSTCERAGSTSGTPHAYRTVSGWYPIRSTSGPPAGSHNILMVSLTCAP